MIATYFTCHKKNIYILLNFFLEWEFHIKSGISPPSALSGTSLWNYTLLQAMQSISSKSLVKYHHVPSMEGRLQSLQIQKNEGI